MQSPVEASDALHCRQLSGIMHDASHLPQELLAASVAIIFNLLVP